MNIIEQAEAAQKAAFKAADCLDALLDTIDKWGEHPAGIVIPHAWQEVWAQAVEAQRVLNEIRAGADSDG